MRVLRLVPCAMLAVLLVSCADEPLMPTGESLGPAFAVGGTDRPFKADLSGTAVWEYDWADPVCPVTTVSDGWGTMTHLGTVHHHSTHCAPVTKPTYENGHWEFTAANGDVLVLEYGGWPAGLPLPLPLQVVGGTGRFTDASGTIYLVDIKLVGEWGDDGNPIEPWYAWWTLEGTISY
ncbi:MAG: hypothetical protein OEO20_03545 [Gemmatimonadota bacterium]|nr:hypothetical protein [Gemmatimonadota bacterium]MDH3366700.1 hypothetical protein [Gemmatimonadota bacterium]MDH3477359.1 hypothetical protein [Gemmatimonadota bacterium]MDH3569329.1 hypothetical protein [Gemmatimonadota bacterium]MDH5549132.1 hypothetical protein [Gemmatimonadota bacterium]